MSFNQITHCQKILSISGTKFNTEPGFIRDYGPQVIEQPFFFHSIDFRDGIFIRS